MKRKEKNMLFTKNDIDIAIVEMKRHYDYATEQFLKESSWNKIQDFLSKAWETMYDCIDKNVKKGVHFLMKDGYRYCRQTVSRAVMDLEDDYIKEATIKLPKLPETYREKFFDYQYRRLLEDKNFISPEQKYEINMQLKYEQEDERRIKESYFNHVKNGWEMGLGSFVVKEQR